MIKRIGILLIVLNSFLANAQEIHFSQYDACPHQLNPATMGAFHGSYRVVLNNKDQWASIGVPYRTSAVALDFGIPFKYDLMGIGISAYQDKAGQGGMNTTFLALSSAYHIALGYDGVNDLAFGGQVSYVQKSVSDDNLTFPNQYDGNFFFDPTANASESIGAPSMAYFNAAFGVHWFYTPDNMPSYFAGITIRNLVRPQDAFFANEINKSIGAMVHAGTAIELDKKLRIYPKFNFAWQGRNTSLVIGGDIEKYKVKTSIEKVSIFGGLYYRVADAFVIVGGADISNIRFALSYDFTVSSLAPAANYLGGAELSFIYKGIFKNRKGFKCPKFDPTF